MHRNWNEGPGVEKHITILVPEPPNGGWCYPGKAVPPNTSHKQHGYSICYGAALACQHYLDSTTRSAPVAATKPRHVVINATGLKVYGVGEWHLWKHRIRRRRMRYKLHLGVDETAREIVAVDLTALRSHPWGSDYDPAVADYCYACSRVR